MKPKTEENEEQKTNSTDDSSTLTNNALVEPAKNRNTNKDEIDLPS